MLPYITFFHNSDFNYEDKPTLFNLELRRLSSKQKGNFNFYWFNDRYYHHTSWIPKYFYLFIKNPKNDGVILHSRPSTDGFNHSFSHLVNKHFVERVGKDLGAPFRPSITKGTECVGPSSFVSMSNIEPDVVVMHEGEHNINGIIVKPDTHKGMKISLFDEYYNPLKFTEIPAITEIVPQIFYSYPFIVPKMIDGKYVYDDWIQKESNWDDT